jgi:transcriptional regulator of acetoin/glycerol metabolism
MNAVLGYQAEADSTHTELGAARRRVAELENELRRLRGESLPHGQSSPSQFTEMRLLEVEGLLVRQAMDRFHGNVSRAARALGLSRSALYRRLERHKV